MSLVKDLFPVFFKSEAVKKASEETLNPVKNNPKQPSSGALISSRSISVSYDGEKTVGNVGPIKKYIPAYDRLRDRSWQLFLDSDLAKTVLSRYILWVVKNGLRLQSTPVIDIIKSTPGISPSFDAEKFARDVEQRFNIWATSKKSTPSKLKTFKQLQPVIFKNKIVGGDVLVILRRKNGIVNVQPIDGSHLVCGNNQILDNGNKLINGIEFGPEGEHVRYHVRVGQSIVKVEAFEKKTGLRVAWLDYGTEHRLDNHRGIPIIATAIESISKTDRYKEATIDQAEEIRKLAYKITHDSDSDGANPMNEVMGKMFDTNIDNEDIKRFESGQKVADDVALSTGRKAVNLGIGSDITPLDAKNELYFKDFYTILANQIASTVGIPADVAYSQYNGNFSSSRAAIQDWGNTIDFARTDFDDQTLGYVYEYWFYYEVWSGRIQAPGFISANESDEIVLRGAYLAHRFVGPKFPHIDPVKEVQAARLRLGTAGDHIPLDNGDDSSELLMSGDFETNAKRFARELDVCENLGIKPSEKPVQQVKDDKES